MPCILLERRVTESHFSGCGGAQRRSTLKPSVVAHGCHNEIRGRESLERFVEVAGIPCDLRAWAGQTDVLVRRSRPTDCQVLETDLPVVESFGAQCLVSYQNQRGLIETAPRTFVGAM